MSGTPKKFLAWLPALLWMLLIFIGSTNLLSSSNTSRFLGPLIRWLAPGISDDAVHHAQTVIRKLGHVSEYAVVAVLYHRALVLTFMIEPRYWCWKRFRIALGLAALYAASDEFHQGFASARDGRVQDVFIDTVGAWVGLMLIRAWSMRRHPR